MEGNTAPQKVWQLIIALSICLVIIFFYKFYKWDNKYGDFGVVHSETSIESNITVLREYKGYTYVRLTNGEQYVISNVYNRLYDLKEFYKHVFSGDSISKRSGSDTLYLHKKHNIGPTRMYFLIGQ